ncbi:tetratricopeptide repeat protein [Nocardia asiatica]|uniref:tetratricopeptide repeat protein n=1 Tax=Nocardia asiatica TaxID=209252 RepID=UPI00245876EA|nr:tetratricopeptide repeat protein [Nocardia asiatica]
MTGAPGAVVVTGMRGAGKSQVAAAYAREVIDTGQGLVGWVDAETPDRLLAGLAEVARRVGVGDPDGDSAVSASRLRDHLSGRREPALLVFDNATDPDLVDGLMPTGGETRVLVTTTDRAFTQLGELVDVGKGFSRDESVHYLEEATGLGDRDRAAEVAHDLEDLPLALSAAAATITGRRLDYRRYRQLLAEQPLPAVLPRRRGADHPLAVDQALLLSIQTTETGSGDPDLDTAVRYLLGVIAMLAPDGVDYAMLPGLDGYLDAALQRCEEGSLLSWSATADVVIMHRLLARAKREHAQTTSTIDELATNTLTMLRPLLFDPSQAFQRREEGARLVGHIEAVWQAISRPTGIPGIDFDLTAMVLATRNWGTRQLTHAADTTRAIDLAHHTFTDNERVFGPDHPHTLVARHNLAHAYESAGRLAEAIPLHEQVVTDADRTLGPDHPHILNSRNNLAHAYQVAGRLAEAIPLHEQNLADSERVLGPDHPDTMTCRNNLAHAYESAGRPAEAIPLHEQNLADRERILGPDHPDTLSSRNNLASAYEAAGRTAEAIELYEQVVTDADRTLGPDHPHTLVTRNNLAGTYESAGRLAEAIPLHEQNLADSERVLGPDHPHTLVARNNLASAYHSAGRPAEAIPLHEQNLADSERILGPDHPRTVIARINLAFVRDVDGGA